MNKHPISGGGCRCRPRSDLRICPNPRRPSPIPRHAISPQQYVHVSQWHVSVAMPRCGSGSLLPSLAPARTVALNFGTGRLTALPLPHKAIDRQVDPKKRAQSGSVIGRAIAEPAQWNRVSPYGPGLESQHAVNEVASPEPTQPE